MNTFLTAMIADLLAPVTGADGLGPSLSRAREHLTSQIEDTGLVRYHGRPDIPLSQRTSCVITPRCGRHSAHLADRAPRGSRITAKSARHIVPIPETGRAIPDLARAARSLSVHR